MQVLEIYSPFVLMQIFLLYYFPGVIAAFNDHQGYQSFGCHNQGARSNVLRYNTGYCDTVKALVNQYIK